jgi:hypothetical protein
MREVDQRFGEQLPWSFTCTEEHRYFVASFAWRNLVWGIPEAEGNGFDRDKMRAAEEALRPYLLDETVYPEGVFIWSHLVAPPDGFTGAPGGIDLYLRGSLDASMNGQGEGLYSIGNFAGYLVVTILSIDGDYFITWTLGTELRPGSEVQVNPRFFPEDPDFRRLIRARAAALHEAIQGVNEKQGAEIRRRVEAAVNPEMRSNSHIIATLLDQKND